MGKPIELKGKEFGCWVIKERAKSRVLNCGTTRTFWVAECIKCGFTFEVSTRNIRRKWVFPSNCDNCKSESAYSKQGTKLNRNINGFAIR